MPSRTLPRLLLIAAVALVLPVVTACDSFKDDIARVQQAESLVPGKSNEAVVREIAGARGGIEWKGGKAEAYRNDNIVLVTADITREGKSGKTRRIELAFINNRETDKVAFEQVLIDGQKQTMLEGAMSLFLLQLD